MQNKFSISGSEFGLSLILNIERYEYLYGSDTDVGIKVRNQRNIEYVS